jgi:hypothetical protein
VDDDEYLQSLIGTEDKWGYHEICKWLPYKPETIEEIAQNMASKGYRHDRPIIIYEGLILDGRHRYEAALKANVDPIFVEFQGTRAEAIDYVTSENVARRHLSNPEKEFFYVQRAEALGVRTRADNQHPKNFGSTPPSAKEHAYVLGVTERTVENWEADRKEIKSDPELSQKAKTFEGYKEAKKELKKRKATKEEAERIAKLKSLGERSEAEASNVERKLDKYREQGIDVDAVKSQKEKDNAREAYREQQRPLQEMADEIARVLIDTKDYKWVATIALAAFPKDGELENAHRIITGQ